MDTLLWMLLASLPLILVTAGLLREGRRENLMTRLGIPAASGAPRTAAHLLETPGERAVARFLKAIGLDGIGRFYQAQLLRAGWRSPAAPGLFILAKLIVMAFLVYVLCFETRVNPRHRVLVGFGAALLVWILFDYLLMQKANSRRIAIQRHIPFWLDLHTTLVEGGLGFDAALAVIVQETKGTREPLFDELDRLSADLLVGKERVAAYRNFAERGNVAELHQVVAAIIQAQQLGTGMADTLRAQADMMRNKIWEEANRRAEQLPVKLLFPTAFGVLPSIFIVTALPGMLNLVHMLRRN